ncbi:alpha/beta fold hydrolase [Roseomonas nepalensis]|uniref:Alpha/beta fold hydrolase n=1 Tax=Muricoccus nepalensis TaxID=1854500 RepID=A0A502F8T8_9PROT|nr:alpha/beta fold hydrolase [Roseomonas nepalensis]TPG45770.1 alpha/beta fold hydrolase [Roseomonas nepalensis]
MSTTELRANGLRFRCRLDGPKGAPWLVFSNSLLTDLTLWDDQVAAFGDRFRILRYDQRGHGGTEVPAGPASFDALASDAAALMAEVGAARATFVGVSMGAATGLLLASRAPGLVSALVLADGQAGTAPGGAAAWQERIDAVLAGGMGAIAEATLRRWFSPASLAEGNPAIPRVRRMIEATPAEGFVACARALQSYDLRAALPALAQPALLVAGANDGAMPATMRGMAGVIPGARFEEIPDAGHLPPVERPRAFNEAIGAFLAARAGG